MLTRFDMNQVFETVFEQMLSADKFLDFITRVNGSLIKVPSYHISLCIYALSLRARYQLRRRLKKIIIGQLIIQSMRVILFSQYTRKERF